MYPFDPEKNIAKAGLFLYLIQLCIIIPVVNKDGENKGSDEGLNSRRKQRWRDGEKTFESVRTVGGKAGTSRRAHRRGRSSGVTFTERPAPDPSAGTGSCAAKSHRQNFCASLPGGTAAYVQANPTPRKIGLLLGLELGLRIGEICGLQWGDFDLKLGTLNTIKKLYDGLDMTLGQFFSCPLFDELDQEIQ